jgi:hypothetical protein
MKRLDLDDIEGIPVFGTLVWKPVRRTLGVTAFGINAFTAANTGDEVVEDHTEERLGHEEVYVVMTGHATFTVDGAEVDAPAGTVVYLDDPSERRFAVAREAGTTVLAIGGRPGMHEVSTWEYFAPALPLVAESDYDGARRVLEEGLAARPDSGPLLFHLARVEALAGNADVALERLNDAVGWDEEFAEYFREHPELDESFASIRDDPRYPR